MHILLPALAHKQAKAIDLHPKQHETRVDSPQVDG
jgi:hypothetical protein